MNKYYTLVIDLYKESFDNYRQNHQVNYDRILEVQTILSNAITEAHILAEPSEELEKLLDDVNGLKF